MRVGLEEFLSRSTDRPFADTTLSKVLAGLPPLGPRGPWIAGGAVRRTLLGTEPASDFDMFFRDAEQLQVFRLGLEARGFNKARDSEHQLTYRGQLAGIEREVQIIRFAFYEDAEAVIDSFDFTICQTAFDGQTLVVGDYTLWDLGRKRLAVHKITYPVASARRLLKYTQQGFYACNGALSALITATAKNSELRTDITYVD